MNSRKLVLNAQDDRPIWAMPAGVVEQLRAALPAEWTLVEVDAPVSSRGDGGSVTPAAIDATRGAEIYIGAGVPREVFLAGQPTLKWVHSTTAGIGSFLYPEMVASAVAFTNSAGIHAPPMAESVLGMMLYFARGFDFALEAQRRGWWEQERFSEAAAPIRELADSSVLIIGARGIGAAVARLAHGFGMAVITLNSRSSRAELEAGLRAADFVIIAVPETAATRGLISAAELALMKPTAVLINVARGSAVKEPDLVEALQRKALRGAGLDVFTTEPLPADSPLWRLDNVLITPHVSAVTRSFWKRQLGLILENLDHYLNNRPLRNLVDKQKGY